jgi:hypothetical protein
VLAEQSIRIISFDLKKLVIGLSSSDTNEILCIYWKSTVSLRNHVIGKFYIEYTPSSDINNKYSSFVKILAPFINTLFNREFNIISICAVMIIYSSNFPDSSESKNFAKSA